MIFHKMNFEEAKKNAIQDINNKASIGEEQEKLVHGTLKNYFEADKTRQEVKIDGFIADIFNEYGIIEIQTRAYDKLRHKLDVYLEHIPVTIVCPIIENTYIVYVDDDNKEEMRKSPKHQSIVHIFKELYKIKYYLNHPNLHFHFVYLDIKDYKRENGLNRFKKIRYTSIQKEPIIINKEENYDNYHDFIHILDGIDEFSVKSLSKSLKAPRKETSYLVLILKYLNLITQTGKIKREYLYKVNR